ncbi:ABC transporter permease [Bacillus sp. JCM 19034]|uniref:ABC transporter permease n=1 Tax=Bacillus sp. JCM 19034 TaxID=1481928 RepID=UPI000781A9CD|nr:ABC transporter permease [Bacillus sp. JCM 19034]
MLKLLKLEMKKHKMFGYVKAACIANIIIIVLACLLPIIDRIEGDAYFNNYEMMFMLIDTMVRTTFIVFSGVLIAELIIDEYKNKTMHLMFMYPIKRHKFILAKLIIVSSFTFLAIVLSNFIISATFYGINSFAHFITDTLTMKFISEQVVTVLFSALSSAGLGLIPLYFGMIRKSVPATIVTTILLVSIIGSNFNGFSLFNVIAIPAALAVIGLIIAYMSIKDIEKVDII